MLSIYAFSVCALAQRHVDVLSNGDLSEWKEKSFTNHTDYQPTIIDNITVIKAHTKGTASGMFREMDVDLTKTPYLNWRWRVDNVYTGNNEQTKEGDDYSARIYVVVSGKLLFWNTRAINYVWSSNQPTGTHWPNAYTRNAQMLAVHTGKDDTGRWVAEKRNVRDDLAKLFGDEISEIHAVAFMSDSDNHKQGATAYYGEIFFTSE